MFWFFGSQACGMLGPQPGIKPTAPSLEGKALTAGPPGNSLMFCSWCLSFEKKFFCLSSWKKYTHWREFPPISWLISLYRKQSRVCFTLAFLFLRTYCNGILHQWYVKLIHDCQIFTSLLNSTFSDITLAGWIDRSGSIYPMAVGKSYKLHIFSPQKAYC